MKRQFQFFTNDPTMDMEFNLCNGGIAKFWCHLYKNEADEYKELSSLALLLLSISPTSVLCEKGFHDCRSDNLNACLAISMCSHSVNTFPFHKFL